MTTANLLELASARDFEQVVLCRDPRTGLESVIAIHDTTLGPSLGGIRMRAYPSQEAAVTDALDLAEAMTYKAALAGVHLGGGKSVINASPDAPNRRDLIMSHARYIGALRGRYIPAVDMGTSVDDLALVGEFVGRVSSHRRDPSYYTAKGVVESIRAAAQVQEGRPLGQLRVAVQGLGHVGRLVVEQLVAESAEVLVSDIDPRRVESAVGELGVTALPVDDVLAADADVVCPCAAGGVITEPVLDRFKARFLVGAANNVLAEESLARQLSERNVVHVPDFVANAGGLIACDAEVRGDDSTLWADVSGIAGTVEAVLRHSYESGTDSVTAAVDLARKRLTERRSQRPHFGAA